MPFLFVDYDQGAGGEYFCRILSESPQAVPLEFITTPQGRTKIVDKFGQFFLKQHGKNPNITPHDTLYDIVPSHRGTSDAKKNFKSIRSIRISNPKDPHLWAYLKHNQKNKVMLEKINFNDPYTIGEIKLWAERSNDNSWFKKIKKEHTNLDIILLSLGKEISSEEKLKRLRKEFNEVVPEPNYPYDLVIPYEALFFNTTWVVTQLKNIFNLDLEETKLDQYYKDYVSYSLNPST